jgi:trehalose synthase
MNEFLERYVGITGDDVVRQLHQLSAPLRGRRLVHINSTRSGGGVAEILDKLVPFQRALGIDASWEVLTGDDEFFECTKHVHNALQGVPVDVPRSLLSHYEDVTAANADRLRPLLADADFVFVHDPQTAALITHFPARRGRWIWRCHIDLSQPHRSVWRYLLPFVAKHDASVFSLADFAQVLPHPVYLITPSIDPLSEKNRELTTSEVRREIAGFEIDRDRPVMLQVSRFDRFKDPLGVIRAYRLVKEFIPAVQLVLAGGGASDDPEGAAVLDEVRAAAEGDPDLHVLLLPVDAHRSVNALQRAANIVIQKSIKEGFGLTVAEAMWKGKVVIGGNTGGIRLQIASNRTGFLVSTPEGAALRARYLLRHRRRLLGMGRNARQFVRENFLLTRQLREYLTLMISLGRGHTSPIELR